MRAKKEDWNKRMKRRMILFTAVLVLFAAAYIASSHMENHTVKQARGTPNETIGALRRVEYQGATYIENSAVTAILAIGANRVTEDAGEKSTGTKPEEQAEFLMLFVINHDQKAVHQLQINRNTMTEAAACDALGSQAGLRAMPIRFSYGYGADREASNKNTVAAAENLLPGAFIDYYISLRMEAVGVFNDALGGVTVTLADDMTADDPAMIRGETIRLNAGQARIFCGLGTEDERGDTGGMARQRAFIAAAGKLLTARIAERTDFISDLLDALGGAITTDMPIGKLLCELKAAGSYAVMPVDTLRGEYRAGEDGELAFYIEDNDAVQWILRVFYRPADHQNI